MESPPSRSRSRCPRRRQDQEVRRLRGHGRGRRREESFGYREQLHLVRQRHRLEDQRKKWFHHSAGSIHSVLKQNKSICRFNLKQFSKGTGTSV